MGMTRRRTTAIAACVLPATTADTQFVVELPGRFRRDAADG